MTPPSGGTGTDPVVEEIAVMITIGVGFMALLGSASLIWFKGGQWLIEHQLLVASTETPLIALPGLAGAGLDLPRLMVILGAIIAALAVGGSAARGALARGKGHSE